MYVYVYVYIYLCIPIRICVCNVYLYLYCHKFSKLPVRILNGHHIHSFIYNIPPLGRVRTKMRRVTCQWLRISHITYMNETCHTYEWVMSHAWISDGTHLQARICGGCPRSLGSLRKKPTTESSRYLNSFLCVPWLIHMCAMTHSDVCHDSCICVTRLNHMCDMTHSDVWHDSFRCVTWPIHTCDVTHLRVW